MTFVKVDLGDALPKVASGKVRELYDVDSKSLLFVASDRISAYDVIMENVRIPSLYRCQCELTDRCICCRGCQTKESS